MTSIVAFRGILRIQKNLLSSLGKRKLGQRWWWRETGENTLHYINPFNTGQYRFLSPMTNVHHEQTIPTTCGVKIARFQSTHRNYEGKSQWKSANKNTAMYMIALTIAVTGLSYAAVPLYRIFCQASGYGGTVVKTGAGDKVEKMEAVRERELTIQ